MSSVRGSSVALGERLGRSVRRARPLRRNYWGIKISIMSQERLWRSPSTGAMAASAPRKGASSRALSLRWLRSQPPKSPYLKQERTTAIATPAKRAMRGKYSQSQRYARRMRASYLPAPRRSTSTGISHGTYCVSACPAGAVVADREALLVSFDGEKCIACELCVSLRP